MYIIARMMVLARARVRVRFPGILGESALGKEDAWSGLLRGVDESMVTHDEDRRAVAHTRAVDRFQHLAEQGVLHLEFGKGSLAEHSVAVLRAVKPGYVECV